MGQRSVWSHPVAIAADIDHPAVMEDPVEQRRARHLVSEGLAMIFEGSPSTWQESCTHLAPMKVLITTESSACDRKTLAAVRSLGRRGVHVTVAGDWLGAEPFWSRYCRGRLRTPSPHQDADAYVDFLLHHLAEVRYDALIPFSDHVTIPVSMHRDRFAERVPVAVPPWRAMQVAKDKLATLEAAREAGIEGLPTHAPGSAAELEEIADRIRYPCVFKLRGGAGSVGLRFVRGPDELRAAYRALPGRNGDLLYDYRPLIQEYIPGRVFDVCMLFNRGEPRAATVELRVRMHRPEGGMSVMKETVRQPLIRDAGLALLRKLEWHGPGMAEFKLDERDGTIRLIEVNGRFYSGVGMTIAAGVDLPYLTAKLARDGDVEPVLGYRVGLRYRWPLPQGLLHAFAARNTLRALWEICGPNGNTRSDLWLSDPLATAVAAVRPFRRTWLDLRRNQRGAAANELRPV